MRILLAEDEKDLNYIIVQKLTADGIAWTAVLMVKKQSTLFLTRILMRLFWIL